MPAPTIVILAAGKGERFYASGGATPKLDAPLGGQTVLDHVLRAVAASGLAWHLVRPAGGTRGMGESIALGVQATADADGWLILPADLPCIRPASLIEVAKGLAEKPVVVPHYRQQHGHPVGFAREYRALLCALCGHEGARSLVSDARRQGKVLDLTLGDSGIVQDVDTLADLARARAYLAAK